MDIQIKSQRLAPLPHWKRLLVKCECSSCFLKNLTVLKNGCDKCNGTGKIEIMGGSDADEWGVIDVKLCECSLFYSAQ